ncbi:uncharacterized protein LOC127597250 isoform X2 [Hippocampus zosterae]|nr:uncharacterized protein LOC127597250 isoform X2 [Hippocampus zosterae]
MEGLNRLHNSCYLLTMNWLHKLYSPYKRREHRLHRTVEHIVYRKTCFSISSSPLSPSTSPNNLGDPRTPWRAAICRIKVVDDLLSVFMDCSIMEFNLKIMFVNENAIDDAGVSREAYSAFWEQFLEQCEGETERVPRLRPDFCEAEWQAVGRIWVKGLLDHGVMPVRLSKAFVLACIHGIDSVDRDILISSFLNYLPPIERSAVEKGLQGTMEESDEEDLLDIFTRMGSHCLPQRISYSLPLKQWLIKPFYKSPNIFLIVSPQYCILCITNYRTRKVCCPCMIQRRPQAKECCNCLKQPRRCCLRGSKQPLTIFNVM